jgi:hypothetical protein
MNIRTLSLAVSSPRDSVFNLLADIENLPKWTAGYCEHVTLVRGRWWAFTSDGEQVVDLETSAGTGVIDLRAGPSPERMTLTPIRVVALAPRRTLITFTLIEAPEQTPEAFERRYRLLLEAADGLLRRFGGGEVHPVDLPQLAELGLN